MPVPQRKVSSPCSPTVPDMGSYIEDPETLTWNDTKQGWLTSILELGAWLGTMYSGFLAEILSRKYAILVNVAVFILGHYTNNCYFWFRPQLDLGWSFYHW